MSRVVITGGASGIVARMAERFAEANDQVAVCDASAEAVTEFAAQNPGIRAVQADVRDEAQMDGFLRSVERDWAVLMWSARTLALAGPRAVSRIWGTRSGRTAWP